MYNEAITYPPRIESRAQSRKRTLAFILSMLLPAPGCIGMYFNPGEADAAERTSEVELRAAPQTLQQYEAQKAQMKQFEHLHSKELRKLRIEKLRKRIADLEKHESK